MTEQEIREKLRAEIKKIDDLFRPLFAALGANMEEYEADCLIRESGGTPPARLRVERPSTDNLTCFICGEPLELAEAYTVASEEPLRSYCKPCGMQKALER
jgi:hypothetical protein